MKSLITLFLLLSISISLFADPWDSMTKEEAENVVHFLKQNPYILDYCDCCDVETVALVKVLSAKIEKSDWDEGKYAVKTQVRKIADIPNSEALGLQLPEAIPSYGKNELQITMNYTWAYNHKTKKAAPIYSMVDYGYMTEHSIDKIPCNKKYTEFPNPFESECDVFPSDYRDWYRLNVIY